jgi:hypothetical protein
MKPRTTKTVTVAVTVEVHRCLWPLVWFAGLLLL